MLRSRAPIFREVRRGKAGKKTVRWIVDFRYLGGRKERFSTEDEARTARDQKRTEVANHGTEALGLTQAERVEFVLARDRLAKLGLTITQAVDFAAKHHRAAEEKKLSDAIVEILKLKAATNKRPRSVTALGSTLEGFARVAGQDRLVSSIHREDLEKWLFGNGWAPATVRSKRIDLRTFFRAAHVRRWTTHNPAAGLEAIHLDDKPPGILTPDQAEALMQACYRVQPDFCGYLGLALFAGIRPDELDEMDASEVNVDRGFAEVRAEVAKTRKRRLVDLSENCKAWIRVGLDLPPTNPRGRMNKVRLAAGFEGYRKRLQGGKEVWEKVEGMEWPHDCLRHSFGSYHLAMWGSQDKTATQMGHRSTDMLFRHYRELVTKQEAEVFWEIKS